MCVNSTNSPDGCLTVLPCFTRFSASQWRQDRRFFKHKNRCLHARAKCLFCHLEGHAARRFEHAAACHEQTPPYRMAIPPARAAARPMPRHGRLAQLVRASRLHRESRGFESLIAHFPHDDKPEPLATPSTNPSVTASLASPCASGPAPHRCHSRSAGVPLLSSTNCSLCAALISP